MCVNRFLIAAACSALVSACGVEPPAAPDRGVVADQDNTEQGRERTSEQLAPTNAGPPAWHRPTVDPQLRRVPNHDADITDFDSRASLARSATSKTEGSVTAELAR